MDALSNAGLLACGTGFGILSGRFRGRPCRRMASVAAIAASWSAFAHNRDDDYPLARLDVALQVKDLLPGAQDEVSVFDRDRK